MIESVQDTVEAFDLPTGMCMIVRNSTPGSLATVSLLSGDVNLPTVDTGGGFASVGPFSIPCRVAVGARGWVSVEVKSDAASASGAGIAEALLDAKGDLIAASAADTAARLAVGTNGQVLSADSAEATGLKWVTPAATIPAGGSGDLQYNAAGSFGAAVGLTYNSTTRQIALTGAALTSAGSIWSIAGTWNNAAAVMGGLTVNVTDTASAAASLLLDLQIGGTSVFRVSKAGASTQRELRVVNGFESVVGVYADWSLLGISSSTSIGFSSGANGGSGTDVAIRRNASGVLAIDSGTAGTFRDLRLRHVRTNATTVAGLVAAATAGAGARGFVTDATSTTFGAAAVGGGANAMPVWCDGAGWFIG